MKLDSELFIKKGIRKTLIISFGGSQSGMGTLALFEFKNFLEKHFTSYDRLFYIDEHQDWYHQGIKGITHSVDETVTHLKHKIHGYERVICIGSSSGGYAAILFGSLLQVTSVIAFIPQTYRTQKGNIDEKYKDSIPFINNTTQYFLYGDLSITNIHSFHHISHCERMIDNSKDTRNITIIRKNPLDLIKIVWIEKELTNLINTIIQE